MRLQLPSRVWLLFILLAAFALRLLRLGVNSLWYDETVSIYLARQDLVSLTRHTAGDIHPPLYYYLLHFWGQLAGWSEFSAAFLSLFFGVVLVALVYRVATPTPTPSPVRRSASANGGEAGVGVLAAFLVAISPFNLWYSQEVRMYTLGAMLGLASVYFFVRMLAGPKSQDASRKSQVAGHRSQVTGSTPSLRFTFHVSRDCLAYIVVTALGLYTLYYFAFLIVFENLVALAWLIRSSRLRITNYELRPWLSSQLAVALLYLPWLPIAFRQATDPPVPPWRTNTPLSDVLLESFSALAMGQSVDWRSPLMWLVLLLVAVLIAFTLFDRTTNKLFNYRAIALLGYTFIPLLLIYILSLWKPLYHVRYIFVYSPAFYILLAQGLTRITTYDPSAAPVEPTALRTRLRITNYELRITQYALLAILVAASALSASNFWFNPRYSDDDLRGAVQRLADAWRPGDAILLDAGYTYTAFDYYYDQPVAWRGRLTEYTPRDARAGAVVLQTGSIGGAANLGWGNPESDFYPTTAEETRAALDRVFAAHPRVWLLRLYDTVVDPDGVIRDYLAQRGRILDDQGFAGESFARVQGYLTPRGVVAELPASATARRVLLGERIALVGFEPETVTVRAGAPLDIDLYWQAEQPTNVDAHLFVGLFASDGKLIASREEILLGNGWGTSRWTPGEFFRAPVRLMIPKDAPAADHVLRASLFNPLTREPLSAAGNAWVAEDGQIGLTRVRVAK
ncbi:MAG: glycosyltransferase family 39 protein [Chloroflexi bacterium]|nr:glycosyltransferase family 39 protein [Chloroflexota bacterium]